MTSRPGFGIVDVTPSSQASIIQSVVPVGAGAIVFALCRAAAQTPVIKLSLPRAPQSATIQVPLCSVAQAGVIECAPTPEAQVVKVKVQVAALRAGKCHKSALRVPTSQVVIVTCWSIRRGTQKGGVLGLWASGHQVIVLLGAYDVVDISGSRTGARVRLANLRFVFFLPSVSRAEKRNLRSVF